MRTNMTTTKRAIANVVSVRALEKKRKATRWPRTAERCSVLRIMYYLYILLTRLRFGKTHSEASRDLKAPTEWLRDKKRPFEQTRWMVKFTSLIVSGLPSVEASLIGPEKLVPRKLTEKIIQIKERLKTARSRQKSYADKRSKPLKFQVGDRVLLKVSPWKGVVPLDEIEIDENLRFVEEPIEIVERDVKKLKRRRNSLGPSSLNSQHGNK
ncbi:hypothetical protein Tco_1428107 [Tanacetum coccineum]